VGTDSNDDDLSNDERRELEELRAENARLAEENRLLREQLASKAGSGRGGVSGQSEHERLRQKAEAQRAAKLPSGGCANGNAADTSPSR